MPHTSAQLPTYAQISALPAYDNYQVPQDWVDYNGHMNIVHYFEVSAHAAIQLSNDVGIDADYMARRNHGVFTVEQHQRYIAEMRLGTNLATHARLVGVGNKAVHIAAYVTDEDNQRLSMIFETMLLHIDFGTRRSALFPDDLRGRLDQVLASHNALGWDPALSGSLAVR